MSEILENQCKIIEQEEFFMETPIKIRIIVMKDCLWIWIGGDSNLCSNLTTAIKNNYSSIPNSTDIFGGQIDLFNQTFCQKLAMKTKLVIYLSYNFERGKDQQIFIERKVLENITKWIY
jgi:hypothetical protein